MLTKCQSLTRLPWLGYTRLRHHDYTHTNAYSPEAQRIMRDICRWHVEEFAYFLHRMKSVPEGEGSCSTTRASCSRTSTPRPIRTRTTGWR